MRYKWIALLLVLMLSCNQSTMVYYVSSEGVEGNSGTEDAPFRHIEEALSATKSFKKEHHNSHVTILISKGVYRLNTSLGIGPELSDLSIVGEGAGKVIIKGSKVLDVEWTPFNDQIWKTKIKENVRFDQVFFNGKQQVLARYPNYNEAGGHWQGHAADAISPERVKTWDQPVGALVHAMHRGEWGGFHYEITGLDEEGKAILKGGHQNNRPSTLHSKYRMVENVFEELDTVGEWYVDRTKNELYFWPENAADLSKGIVEGVTLKQLVTIEGSEEKPVKNITIEGITFKHSRRTLMESYEPLLRSDWTIYRGAAIFVEGTEHVNIKNCEFKELGGNVIFASKYNDAVHIYGNHIHDCGATAIAFVGDPSAVRSPSFQYGEYVPFNELDTVRGPKNNMFPQNSVVDNNLIYRIGRIEKQTAGVHISMAMDITVSNNSIYDVPRSGINVSEGTWGGHIIEYNDVFNTVLETSDHGAFNSWGRDRFWHPNRTEMDKITKDNLQMTKWDAIHTSIIRNNRFRCDHGWDIDLDDGSTNYEIYNNVCLKGGIKLREGFFRTVENNIMVNNSFHPHVWFENSQDIFRKNIVLTKYRDIRLNGWGNEIDHNLFPDEKSLETARKNGTDTHSNFGDPLFRDPENGDFSVAENSPALKVGFKNFPMDQFGVKIPMLKGLSKTPEIPFLWTLSAVSTSENKLYQWLGAQLKNIETLEERSASGLNETKGVLVVEINKKSIIGKSNLKKGDIILSADGKPTDKIKDLLEVGSENMWKGKLELKIFRNQKEDQITLVVK